MTKNTQHICISHDADLDGVASAILLTRYIEIVFGVTPKVLFASYDNVGEMIKQAATEATHLWISDLSVRDLDIVDCLSKYDNTTLYFFDHHADTAAFVAKIQDHATVRFVTDGSACAADLIWEYIQHTMVDARILTDEREVEASCLKYLRCATHSRDLWVNNVPEGADLSAVIALLGPEKSYSLLIEDLSRVYRSNFTELMNFCVSSAEEQVDKAIKLAKASMIKSFYLPESPKSRAAGLTVVAAMTVGCQSEVGNVFLSANPRTLVALINLEKLTLSFRTTPLVIQQLGFGVNEIAREFEGGGGHPYAAGAHLTTEILMAGPRDLLRQVVKIIDEKVYHKEGISAE